MACKLIKKGVLGAALGAGVLALLFGTAAPSYVRTAFHKVRHNAAESVPIQFQIDRARQQVADLDPAIRDNIETLARAEEDVKELDAELVSLQDTNAKEGKTIVALRDSLASGNVRLAGRVSYTPDELKTELGRRLEHYRQVKKIIAEKERALKSKQKAVQAAQDMLANIQAEKRALLTKIEEIEARHKAIEATRAHSEFHFDSSALAQAKKSIAELERRLNVQARAAELEGRYGEASLTVEPEPTTGDILKEVDDEFGGPAPQTADKSY